MDAFFLRNRLSSWLDNELPPSEQGRIQQALENDPVLSQEAEAFAEKVKRIRALRVEAPESLEALVSRPAPPSAFPWGAVFLGGGAMLLLGVLVSLPHSAPLETPATVPTDASAEAPAEAAVEVPAEAAVPVVAPAEAPAKPSRIPTQDIPISDSKITVINTPPPGMTTIPSRPRRRSSLQVVIPKEFVEDPDATEWVEDDLPASAVAAAPAAPQPYRFRLVPTDSDKVLSQLAALTNRLGGRFLNTSGGVKAAYPMDPETTERVQLQVSAANVEVLLQNLSSCGTVSPLSQPSEPPVAGMVGVFVEVTAP